MNRKTELSRGIVNCYVKIVVIAICCVSLSLVTLYLIDYISGINGLSLMKYSALPIGVVCIVTTIFYLMPHIRLLEKHVVEKRALEQV
jgi:hypothetical protein